MIKLKIDSKLYYKNKLKFKKLYKSLGLVWMENTRIGDVWAAPDKMEKSGYVRKIPEEGTFKRFIVHNCPEMVLFLKGIGATEIVDEPFESVVIKEPETFIHEKYGHYVFHKKIEEMGDNLKVVIGNSIMSSEMSDKFKKNWLNLSALYVNYRAEDFYKEIEMKGKLEDDRSKEDEVKEIGKSENIEKKTGIVDVNKRRVVIIKRKKKV